MLYGVLQGIAMVLLVPIVRSLFDADYGAVLHRLAVLAVVVLGAEIAHYVQSMKAFRMALTAMRMLHHRLGDHLVTLPLGWFTRSTVGEASQIAVKGTTFVGTVGAHLIGPVVLNVVSALTVVAGLLIIDPWLGLTAVAGTVVLVAAFAASSRMVAGAEGRNHATGAEVDTRLVEFARAQPTLRAFGRRGTGYLPLRAALEHQHRVGRSALWGSVSGLSIAGLATQAVLSGMIAAGAWLVLNGHSDAVTAVAAIGLAARFTSPIGELAGQGSALRMAGAEIERIAAVLRTPALPEPAAPVRAPGEVAFEEVRFGYGDRTVLNGVSFTVPARGMTALVGPSDSGKTTVTRLIARFYDVTSGRVLLGGTDVRELDTATLMAQVSLVFQDVYLFDDTLWENVRVGREMMKTQDRNPVFRAVSARMQWTCGQPAELAALGLTLRESRTFGTPQPAVAARWPARQRIPLRLFAWAPPVAPLPRLNYQLPRPRSSEPSSAHRRRTALRTRPRNDLGGSGAGARTSDTAGRRNRAGAIIRHLRELHRKSPRTRV